MIPGGIRVTHSELMLTINSSVAFTVGRILVQPGSANFSTWLSTEAANFDQYRLVSLTVEYEPRCGTNNSGNVMVGFDYDPSDRAPITELSYSSYQGVAEGAPWLKVSSTMNPSAVHATGPRKYLRDGPVSGDLRTYDSGSIFICTQDGPAVPILWGKLWVHYTFDLLVPTAPTQPVPTQAFEFATSGDIKVGPAAIVALPFATQLTNFDSAFSNSVAPNIRCPTGSFLLTVAGIVQITAPGTAAYCDLRILLNGLLQATTKYAFPIGAGSGLCNTLFAQFPVITTAGDIIVVQIFNGEAAASLIALTPFTISFLSV